MSEKKNVYTIKQVSDLSGISEEQIIRMVVLKKIQTVRIGKNIRIKEEELEKFLDSLVAGRENSVIEFEHGTVLYTAEQIARILQLSVDNVWILLKSGKLKGFKIREGKSSWRIPSKNLEEFIESRSTVNAKSR
ncbi:MAG: helix-turn-helix domain-containing protein [Cyanobacteria bacterium]|nr:helix-turn-helix domain-containing protein [Cyanobacteriota bacterium]